MSTAKRQRSRSRRGWARRRTKTCDASTSSPEVGWSLATSIKRRCGRKLPATFSPQVAIALNGSGRGPRTVGRPLGCESGFFCGSRAPRDLSRASAEPLARAQGAFSGHRGLKSQSHERRRLFTPPMAVGLPRAAVVLNRLHQGGTYPAEDGTVDRDQMPSETRDSVRRVWLTSSLYPPWCPGSCGHRRGQFDASANPRMLIRSLEKDGGEPAASRAPELLSLRRPRLPWR